MSTPVVPPHLIPRAKVSHAIREHLHEKTVATDEGAVVSHAAAEYLYEPTVAATEGVVASHAIREYLYTSTVPFDILLLPSPAVLTLVAPPVTVNNPSPIVPPTFEPIGEIRYGG